MAVALVQTAKYTGTVAQTNMTFTLGQAPVVGNKLFLIICFYTGDDPVVTPSGWTLEHNYEPNSAGVTVFSRTVQSGDGTSWNLTVLSQADQNSGFLVEVSGQATISYINQLANSTSTSTPSSLATGNVTPSVLNCLAIAAWVNDGSGGTDSATVSSGWTKDQAAESSFQPAWLAHRNSLTSDTTTAINCTISSMNGGGADASTVIFLVAPAAVSSSSPAGAVLTDIPNRYVGPVALRRLQKQPVPNYPIVPTFIPPYPNATMGMNIGNDQINGGSWLASENDTDLATISSKLVQKRVRIAIPTYSDASSITNMRQLCLEYKANGYKVSYGVTGNGGTQNATTYAAWKAQVPTEAAWAAANNIDTFYIGNEEDWQAQLGLFGTITDATVRTDVLSLASTLKASYPNMRIVYSTAQGTVSQWHTAGTGSLDGLGFNMYDTLANFGPNITYFMSQIGSKYFVSEWGPNHPYYDLITTGDDTGAIYTDWMYQNDIASRYSTLVANGLEAYFFAYRFGTNQRISGNWNILDNNNIPLPGYEQAFGVPSLPYPTAVNTVTIANPNVGPMALRKRFRMPYVPESITPSYSTTQQTQLGKARIQVVTSQTITGLSRITVTTTQTQTGKARITITTTQTQLGKARITATTQQTMLGKARITVTTQQTITGKARITATTSQTQLGKARITATTAQTILGKSRITATTTQTQLGKSRITATTTQTQLGKSRITVTTTQTILGVSRITIVTTQTQLGKSRVQQTTTQTQLGKANIAAILPGQVIGNAQPGQTWMRRFAFMDRHPFTLTGFMNQTQQVQLGKARIQVTTNQTQLGHSRITITSSQTQLGKARITITTVQTQLGKARITIVTSQTLLGRARITVTTTQTQLGRARITITTLQTQTGKARVTVSTPQLQLGRSRITVITSQTQLGRARVMITTLQTIAGKSRITISTPQTLLGRARITAITDQIIFGKSRIQLTTLQTIRGISRVQLTTAQTMAGKANIFVPVGPTHRLTVELQARDTTISLHTEGHEVALQARDTSINLRGN